MENRDTETLALAEAVGVLTSGDRHRPPLQHVSPSAALIRNHLGNDVQPTRNDVQSDWSWRDVVAGLVLLVAFWAAHVLTWGLWGAV